MKYLIETKFVPPIDYENVKVEGEWGRDNSLDFITGVSDLSIPVYPVVEIPDGAICVSIETERMRSKFNKEPYSMRICRVLYLMPVGSNEVQP